MLRDELYVMLMLMRSDAGEENGADCDDPVVKAACLLESDACPAECKENNSDEDNTSDNTNVKSGDLAVTAKAADGRKALIGGTSDLDTITFKTSEDVVISKVTLERYGYSTIDDVVFVRLEDEDGNVIADAKELNSKGQVNLSIKKDYKTVDGTYKATVVVKTRSLPNSEDLIYGNKKNGSTIGFKVISVESTAKNLNLDDYNPYTYDLVNYDGSKVEFSSRNSSTKEYNYEAGELYEVAKFRVKAPSDATILVKGFTLNDDVVFGTYSGGTIALKIDAGKYVEDVKITVDGTEVKGLKWNINKDDELVVSFSDVELTAKQTSTFAVKVLFNEDFDQFGYGIQYNIADITKFNAIDKKTETRITAVTGKKPQDIEWTTYTIKGGKIKLTSTKLGTVNAAAGATNVKVAQGEITVSEAIRGTASIEVNSNSKDKIDEIRLVINGEEYDGTSSSSGYIFKGLEIEKSGAIEVRVDIKSDKEGNIEFASSLSSDLFDLEYDESGNPVDKTNDIVGSISLSNIRIQAAKADLSNKTTKEVELVKGELNRKTIFDGTYSAKKGAVTLKNFLISSDGSYGFSGDDKVTMYITIDGEEYDAKLVQSGGSTTYVAKGSIDDIEIADGKSVNVKLEIEMTPKNTEINSTETFNIKLDGEDEDNNPAGEADEDSVRVKIVEQGTLNLNSNAKNTVILKSEKTLAEFRVKPSKSGSDDIELKNIILTGLNSSDIKVVIDGETYAGSGVASGVEYRPEITVPSEGITVKVSLKTEVETGAEKILEVVSINGNISAKATFKKYFVPAILTISQSKNGDTTRYTVDVDNDTSDTVSNLVFYVNSGSSTDGCTLSTSGTNCSNVAHINDSLSETNNTLSAINDEKAKSITAVSYKVGDYTYFIDKNTYEDFFKVGSDDLMVYSNK